MKRITNGELHQLGLKYGTDKATFHGYCDFYQEHLPTKINSLLEIGVMDGASLRMWRDYYPDAEIYGVENDDSRAISAKVNGAAVLYGDATDAEFVRRVIKPLGPFDVIIDDGSHMTLDQQVSMNLLWRSVARGGVYVVEDLHTSFMSNYVNTSVSTVGMLQDWFWNDDFSITWFAKTQGSPKAFISRHGFDPTTLDWTGGPTAQSITAIIRKEG